MCSSQNQTLFLFIFTITFAAVASFTANEPTDCSWSASSFSVTESAKCCTAAVNSNSNTRKDEFKSKPAEHHKVVALILARGGSKGIPLKNLQTIGGISLLARSLRLIHEIGCFEDVWVSTDHNGIAIEAERNGAKVHRRPDNVSEDTTPSIVSVQEFLLHRPEITHLALIQCTSVFLRASYLQEAFHKIQYSDCVFAATRSWKLRWQLLNEKLTPINFQLDRRPRRQDWQGELLETGMFYFARRELLDSGSFQNDKCSYVDVASEDALEIDSPLDLDLARHLVEKLKQ